MKTKGLQFHRGNAKIGKDVYTFSLPAGHACPFASLCLAKADRKTGRLTDGPKQEFRCFAATAEAAFPSVRKSRWRNFEAAKKSLGEGTLVEDLLAALPERAKTVRVHVGGDFFSQAYFDAWLEVAEKRPEVTFYAYTKSLPFWLKRENAIPQNLRLTASLGGKEDKLVGRRRQAEVVLHPAEARNKGLEIDHDDHIAQGRGKKNFALLLHGSQRRSSEASQALSRMKREGINFGYSQRTKEPDRSLPLAA